MVSPPNKVSGETFFRKKDFMVGQTFSGKFMGVVLHEGTNDQIMPRRKERVL